MDTLLTIILIAVVAGMVLNMLRPAPRPQVIYVPIEVAEARGKLGCLPLIVVGALALLLLALGVIRV